MLREQFEDVSTIAGSSNPQALPSELPSITAPPKGRGVDRESGLPPAGKEPAPESPGGSFAVAVAKSYPRRRVLVSALLVLLLVLVGAAYWFGNHGIAGAPTTNNSSSPPPSPRVTVSKPLVKEVTEYDEYTGRFEAVDIVEVRSRVPGYLDQVIFKDGTLIKKGDVLAIIDKRPYQAALDQAEALVLSARARVAFAQKDFERAQMLSRGGNISEQVLEQRRQTMETAKADVLSAEAAVETARLNLGFTEIRAPIAGRISRKLVSEGNLVSADTTLLTTIVSLDPIYFYFDVDERSFLKYQALLKFSAIADAGSLELSVGVALTDERDPTRKGTLDFVDNRLDQASGTMRARAAVENKDLFLTPGLFGTIRVPGSLPHSGVLVPDEAIATDQDRRVVWVVGADETVSTRTVRPGTRIDGYRLIHEGLSGDEMIVVAGLQRLRPGAKVSAQLKGLPPTREALFRSPQVPVQ